MNWCRKYSLYTFFHATCCVLHSIAFTFVMNSTHAQENCILHNLSQSVCKLPEVCSFVTMFLSLQHNHMVDVSFTFYFATFLRDITCFISMKRLWFYVFLKVFGFFKLLIKSLSQGCTSIPQLQFSTLDE